MSYFTPKPFFGLLVLLALIAPVRAGDSLLKLDAAPQSVDAVWAGYDPRAEPLNVRVVREWTDDGIVMRYITYTIGTFKGKEARMAAFYGFPKGGKNLPALLHMHGGGQRAFQAEVKRYAQRGYAVLSVNWGGRPMEDAQPNDPNTDWGAVDPTQNHVAGYSSLLPESNGIDPFPSARNNNWFLLTVGCRRGITFLEQQPEVDKQRIGVYGHSMGGRLTGLVAGTDGRVRAASPSVGGSGFLQTDYWGLPGTARHVSGDVELFRKTIAGQAYLARVRCPILFLSATDDFNAPMDCVVKGMNLVPHENTRVVFAPHLNHRFTPETEISRPLWFDAWLQHRLTFPKAPAVELILKRDSGVPLFRVRPDRSRRIVGVDIYYGYDRDPRDRFWADARATEIDGVWQAECPVFDLEEPLFVLANVKYQLADGERHPGDPDTFVVSACAKAYPDTLQQAGVKATEHQRRLIDDFAREFHDWYTLNPTNREHWFFSTRKLADPRWEAPRGASLTFEVKTTEPGNTLAVQIHTDTWRNYCGRKPDVWTALVRLDKAGRSRIELNSQSFTNTAGKPLKDWYGITELIFRAGDKLEHPTAKHLVPWKGDVPELLDLRWEAGEPIRRPKPYLANHGQAGAAAGLGNREFQQAIDKSVKQERLDAAESAPAPVTAAFDREGRVVMVKAPGLSSFASEFSASVELNGTSRRLSSAAGASRSVTASTVSTPYGPAETRTSTIHFDEEHVDLMLKLGSVPGVPGVLLQAGIRNAGAQALKLSSLTPVEATASRNVSQWPREYGRIYLDPAYAKSVKQDWGQCQRNLAVSGKALSMAGQTYTHGLGTHARSEIVFRLDGRCERFHAMVGADDAGGGSMAFEVWTDGDKAFDSGTLRKGDPSRPVDVSVQGVRFLRLVVTDAGNGIHGSHADWADAYVTIADSAPTAEDSTQASGITVEGKVADWLITRLVGNFEKSDRGAVCVLDSIDKPLNIYERGCLYRRDGVGFLFGPVGEPIAYLNERVACVGMNRVSFAIDSDMSGIQVDPGETRWGQQAILLWDKPNAASALQAEWVAKTHHARTDKGALSGWCSWYLKTSHITGEDVLGLVDAVASSNGRLRPAVIQIDDGYQKIDGVWDANEKFPQGMAYYARRIAATGARPGLWMALTMIGRNAPWLEDPNHMATVWGQRFSKQSGARPDETGGIDPTHPLAKARIADRVRHAVSRGFTYLKLDFNNIGGGNWYEKKRTSFQIMRDHYTNIRQAAGEDTYILFCTTHPIRAVVGLVDASRISSDVFRGGIRNGMDQVLRSYDLNNRWFAVDDDCYYLAPDVQGAGQVAGGWPLIRTWASMMGLSCGAAFTSDMWQWDGFKPYWRVTEILTPPARERTRVLDLGTSTQWPRLISDVHRSWGDWSVALLWNPNQESRAITLDFAGAGLDPSHRYAVWSFWDNQYLGIHKGKWVTPSLPAGGCQHLCLTDLDRQPDHPIIIGSNLHIFCGAAEIKNVQYTPVSIVIDLTDAGAREGDLFIHSRNPLRAGQSVGCRVTTVEAAGEDIWRIHLEDRACGKQQKVELNIVGGE